MSKIIAFAIVTTLTLIPITPGLSSSPTNPPPNEMEVMVLFSGLMVFHKKQAGDSYEVGILSQQYSPGHDFCIQRLGAHPFCRPSLPDGAKWSFTLDHEPGGPPIKVGHNNRRRPDDAAGQYDFDWIIDLEALHGKELTLNEGRLQPIITLPKVKLFTKYKSYDLVYWQGKKPQKPQKPSLFGFAAEAIGFVISLKQGESLTLKDDVNNQEILKVSYKPPPPIGSNNELITISNVRHTQGMDSDFWLYYQLFANVDVDQQFDFYRNEEPQGVETAFNQVPEYSLPVSKTCCMLDCTSILLGTRTNDLK